MHRGWRRNSYARSMKRSFSSKEPKQPPSIMEGFEGMKEFWKRCVDRAPTYEKYKHANVLSPSAFPFTRRWGPVQFAMLQLPTLTEIDLFEFLEGAQMASELVTRTFYDEDFRKYALSLPRLSRKALFDNTGEFYEAVQALEAREEPDCVKMMRKGVSEVCFEAVIFSIQNSKNTKHTVELCELDVDRMYLENVGFRIVPQSILQESRAFRTYACENNSQEGPETADTIQDDIKEEVLELRVISRSKEHIKVYADGNHKQLTLPNRASWAFASCVTTPEQLDWRIAGIRHHTVV